MILLQHLKDCSVYSLNCTQDLNVLIIWVITNLHDLVCSNRNGRNESSPFESTVKIQTWFRECKRRRIIHEIRLVTEFSLLLKNALIKTLTVLVNRNHFAVKLLHWHEQEIYWTFLFLYTFRYIQVLYLWLFFAWERYSNLQNCWYLVTNLAQSLIMALLAGGTFTTINQVHFQQCFI